MEKSVTSEHSIRIIKLLLKWKDVFIFVGFCLIDGNKYYYYYCYDYYYYYYIYNILDYIFENLDYMSYIIHLNKLLKGVNNDEKI